MINITVKTLDARNHQFSVDDDMTVEEFKRHIADTVDIPSEIQRIIYSGHVLHDSARLNDCDLDGKVVHLVNRPPPSANASSARSSRSSSPPPPRRLYRNLDHANTMLLGSVAFPSNFMDSQGLRPPSPTHNHAGSRLNVARRMLRRAEQLISQLENPNESNESIPVEDPQDELTPVIEARVILPGNSSEPIDEAAILSAVHNYSNLSGQNRRGTSSNGGNSSSADPAGSSTTNSGNSQSPEGEQSSGFPENATRTSSMAEVLTMLTRLQLRFAPFIQRYLDCMLEDPTVAQEVVATVQTELDRISEVMHFLGHAYHSLSDIIVRLNMPPPRPLLCRPILIHHSAVLQTGIPIALEAQFNISSERPSTAPASQSAPAGDTAPPNTTAQTATSQPFPSQAVPLINTVRLPFPVEVRNVVPSQNVNATQIPATGFVQRLGASMDVSSGQTAAGSSPSTTSSNGGATASTATFTSSNPEMEFIMEVTPEGIRIDSLDSGLFGSNQVENILRGAQQSPNFIQTLMQMAGQYVNRTVIQSRNVPPTAPAPPASVTSVPPLTPTPPTQNSQARGNNQTHPTSSTQTRSTARPHVHLQHQSMQGGFDPFLPCNSHHVSRRRSQTSQQQQQQATPSSTQRNEPDHMATAAQEATTQLNSLVSSILNSIRTTYSGPVRRTGPQPEGSSTGGATAQGAGEGAARPNTDRTPSAPPAESNLPNFSAANFAEMMRSGPTLAELLQQFPPDDPYVAGESIITDFIMLVSRHMTIGDVVSLNGGNIAPIGRMAGEIQSFFLTTLMDGSRSTSAVESGVERLLNEMQPFLDALTQLHIRDDIDIEASVRRLVRERLPNILLLCSKIADEPGNLRQLVDQCVAVVKDFCALALHACADGIQGVDQLFEIIATRYMQGISIDIQDWTLLTSRTHLRQLVSNLNVPLSSIQPYIVRRDRPDESMSRSEEVTNLTESEQPMETDEVASSNGASSSPISRTENYSDPLPNVVIGSEPWHNQVPADWVPIITKDAQRQKKQNSQPPFSDAYLSGMPSKRRKIVHGAKGRQDLPLPQLIAESVRRAVTSTGLSSAAPLEVVAQAAGSSTDIQTAYRGLLRSSVQSGLRNNDEFTPERFPHATSYFREP